MKRSLRALVLAIAAALACATLPVSAAGDRQTESYLTLGDSYAFAYSPLLDPRNAANFKGYADSLASTLGLNLTNAACPGETSGSMISGTPPDNGCHENYPPLPLHVSYTGSQLKFALHFLRTHHDTDLITLQIGGNDVLVLLNQCNGNATCVLGGLGPVLTKMRANLDIIYDAIRHRAHYEGTIVAVPYFSFNYNDRAGTTVTALLDDAVKAEALQHGAQVADVFDAFYAASAPSHVPCLAGLQIPTPGAASPCDIHPSAAGHAVIAAAIIAVLPREERD